MSDAPYVPAPSRPRLLTPANLFAAGIAMSFFWGAGILIASIFFTLFAKV